MNDREREALAAISNGYNNDTALARHLKVHPQTVRRYARALTTAGHIETRKGVRQNDPRFRFSGSPIVNVYQTTATGQAILDE